MSQEKKADCSSLHPNPYDEFSQPEIPVKIVNLTHEADIKKMIENCRHDKRVTLDLDEVIFCSEDDPFIEKTIPSTWSKLYKERIRLGVPALFHFFAREGYDIWVYSSGYYSFDYIQKYFLRYQVNVSGVVTGTARKSGCRQAEKKRIDKMIASKYLQTVHIDDTTILKIDNRTKEFEEFKLSGSPATWSGEIAEIMSGWNDQADSSQY